MINIACSSISILDLFIIYRTEFFQVICCSSDNTSVYDVYTFTLQHPFDGSLLKWIQLAFQHVSKISMFLPIRDVYVVVEVPRCPWLALVHLFPRSVRKEASFQIVIRIDPSFANGDTSWESGCSIPPCY